MKQAFLASKAQQSIYCVPLTRPAAMADIDYRRAVFPACSLTVGLSALFYYSYACRLRRCHTHVIGTQSGTVSGMLTIPVRSSPSLPCRCAFLMIAQRRGSSNDALHDYQILRVRICALSTTYPNAKSSIFTLSTSCHAFKYRLICYRFFLHHGGLTIACQRQMRIRAAIYNSLARAGSQRARL